MPDLRSLNLAPFLASKSIPNLFEGGLNGRLPVDLVVT